MSWLTIRVFDKYIVTGQKFTNFITVSPRNYKFLLNQMCLHNENANLKIEVNRTFSYLDFKLFALCSRFHTFWQ